MVGCAMGPRRTSSPWRRGGERGQRRARRGEGDSFPQGRRGAGKEGRRSRRCRCCKPNLLSLAASRLRANLVQASECFARSREEAKGPRGPVNKPLAGPKALQNDRSGRWCRVVNLTLLPLFGPSGYWAAMLGWGARRGSGGGSPAEARRRRGGTLLTSRGVGGVDDSLSSSHPCAPAPLREVSPYGKGGNGVRSVHLTNGWRAERRLDSTVPDRGIAL
jgi:hypothetical protein